MKRTYPVPVFLVLAAAIVGTVTVRSTQAEPEAATVAPIPVRVEMAATGSFRARQSASGFVSGVRQTDVAPKVGGYIVKLLKEEGDPVRAGEPIAILDGSELLAMNQSAQLSLDTARKSLQETKDFYEQTVDQTEASLRKAEDSYDSGDITSRDLDIAKEALKSAKRMRDAQSAAAAVGKAAAEGGALIAGASAANATVTAPFSGIVTRRYVSLGSFVAPGTPVYTVSSTDALEIGVPVANSVMKNIRKGDMVEVTSEGTDTSVSGHVFSMAQAVGVSTQSSIARIRFADADVSAMLRPGQYVTVSIPVGPARDAILIPENAIVHEYDDTFVFTIGNGVATKTKISVGEEVDGRYEISSGLSVGEEVVIEGSYGLRDGESVTVSE
jgi:RND family efflux transporter MFP subunit